MANPSPEKILAIITHETHKVSGGGAPIFFSDSIKASEKTALTLSRILDGAVHDLENGVYIIVAHS